MNKPDVRIVELPPMRVACAHGFGPEPEGIAWQKLIHWAASQGLLQEPQTHRIFGFNNPDPSPGSPNYGYEFQMVVGPEIETDGEIEIKLLPGGQYAALHCSGIPSIGQRWQQLAAWRENSRYRYDASRQWLEEHLGPAQEAQSPDQIELDLLMPIA